MVRLVAEIIVNTVDILNICGTGLTEATDIAIAMQRHDVQERQERSHKNLRWQM